MAGQVFGRWTVLGPAPRTRLSASWFCRCACGVEQSVSGNSLRMGKSTSCGCARLARKRATVPDLTGRRVHRLTVVGLLGYEAGQSRWLCTRDCGNDVIATASRLMNATTRSCGCARSKPGSTNHAWRHDLSPEEREIHASRMRSGKSVEWREAVFARDHHRCVKCGQHGTLNAHHMDGFDWYIEGRYDVENGCTLCVACHRAYHAEFGQKRANCHDFLLFLDDDRYLELPPGARFPISVTSPFTSTIEE